MGTKNMGRLLSLLSIPMIIVAIPFLQTSTGPYLLMFALLCSLVGSLLLHFGMPHDDSMLWTTNRNLIGALPRDSQEVAAFCFTFLAVFIFVSAFLFLGGSRYLDATLPVFHVIPGIVALVTLPFTFAYYRRKWLPFSFMVNMSGVLFCLIWIFYYVILPRLS